MRDFPSAESISNYEAVIMAGTSILPQNGYHYGQKYTNSRVPRQMAIKITPRHPIPSLKKMLFVNLQRAFLFVKVWMSLFMVGSFLTFRFLWCGQAAVSNKTSPIQMKVSRLSESSRRFPAIAIYRPDWSHITGGGTLFQARGSRIVSSFQPCQNATHASISPLVVCLRHWITPFYH
jgi:hypothetical protein